MAGNGNQTFVLTRGETTHFQAARVVIGCHHHFSPARIIGFEKHEVLTESDLAKTIHSMIRVLDEARSVDFYNKAFGLEVAQRLDFETFTLIYLSNGDSPFEVELTGWVPTLELTVYVRALPVPGPVRVLQKAQLIDGQRVDVVPRVRESDRERGRVHRALPSGPVARFGQRDGDAKLSCRDGRRRLSAEVTS